MKNKRLEGVSPQYIKEIIASGKRDGERYWALTLSCGHRTTGVTRRDAKKYPYKEEFCPTCFIKMDGKD